MNLKIIPLTLISFLAACSTHLDPQNSQNNIISGHVVADGLGPCTIDSGRNTQDISCQLMKSEEGPYFVELNLSKVTQQQAPSCIFEGFAATAKMKSTDDKVKTIPKLISTSQVWVSLPTVKAVPTGQDLLFQFICAL
jgi:hypothetical protein